jgi:hypothetical protein
MERTICDLLRCRSSIEVQTLQGALKMYARRKEKNLRRLMQYAGMFRVEKFYGSIWRCYYDKGMEFQVKSISEIMDESEYPGIRVSMATVFDGVVTPLKIDISTGDAITPKAAPKARRSVASLTMYPTRKKQITAGSSPALRVTAG